MPVPHNADRHALYRFYGETGQLLYAGISNDPGRRFGQHGATKSWWPTVRGITLEWHSSRRDALAAEARVIEVERPLFNVQRPGVQAPPRDVCGHCESCSGVDTENGCYLDHTGALDVDEAPPAPCPHCTKTDCLYMLGLDHGGIEGWQAGFHAGVNWRGRAEGGS